MVQEGEGKESKHTANAEGLGDAQKWHGKGSSSVLSQTTLPVYRDPSTDPPTVSLIL